MSYRGPDAGEEILDKILMKETLVMQHIKDASKEIIMTPKLKENATLYHICEESCCEQDLQWVEEGQNFKKGPKVRDHFHFTGVCKWAAYNGCNLSYMKVEKIPVFFHNFGGYDGHYIFQNLHKIPDIAKPFCYSKIHREVITFSSCNLYFKDLAQFLSASLDELGSNLKVKAIKENNLVGFLKKHEYFLKNIE